MCIAYTQYHIRFNSRLLGVWSGWQPLVRLFSNNMWDPGLHSITKWSNHARSCPTPNQPSVKRFELSKTQPQCTHRQTVTHSSTHAHTHKHPQDASHSAWEWSLLSTHFMFMFIPDTRLCSIATSLLQQIENNAEIDKSECWALWLKSSRYIRGMQCWYICDPLIFCRNTNHTFDPSLPPYPKQIGAWKACNTINWGTPLTGRLNGCSNKAV